MENADEIFKNNILITDYHTHTFYSHGKGSVAENALAAKEKGLTEIGIAEHGTHHRYFKRKLHEFSELRDDAKNAQDVTGVKVLVGIESNILDFDGNCDFIAELDSLDYVSIGMHCQVKTKFKYFCHLFFRRKIFPNSKKQIELNTQIMLSAIEKNKMYVDFFTHPTRKFPCDIIKVATAMRDANILFELNTASCNISESEIKKIAATGVKFIVGSDAHTPSRVGELTERVSKLLKYIPREQLVTKLEPKLHVLREGKN